MEQIFNEIQNPIWIFSVIIVGLFINVLAAFIKDWLSLTASKYSAKARHKRHKRLVKMAKQIRAIKSDSRLLIIHGLKLVFNFVIYGFGVFLALTALPILRYYHDNRDRDPFGIILPPLPGIEKIISIGVVYIIIFLWMLHWKIYKQIKIFSRVDHEIHRFHKITKI